MSGEIEQGSDAWRQIRLGKVTASRIGDLMARTKSGPSASRAAYMGELVAERMTGQPVEKFQSAAMKQGTELEPQARAAYEFLFAVTVEQIGFVPHPWIEMAGCSPDGLVGDVGLLEIKCPQTHTHIETLLGAEIAKSYRDQMQFQMACTGRLWCDFVSFCPALPSGMDVHIRRVERDNDYIAEMEDEIIRFLAELDAKIAALRERYGVHEMA
jgi:putative phage-type endonuclease